MNTIERYLGKIVAAHTLLVLIVLLLILGFSELMQQIESITAEYTMLKAVLYTLLTLPIFAYHLFPLALLIGTLIALGGLANHSELTVLRVTGWSIGRIFIAVMKTVFILWILVAVTGEWLAPKSENLAKQMRGEALNQSLSMGRSEDFWLKEDNRYIHVSRIISDQLLHHVTIYNLNDDNEITAHWFAKQANFQDGKWWLENITKQDFNWSTAYLGDKQNTAYPRLDYQQQAVFNLEITLPITPELIRTLQIDAPYMSVWDLYQYIGFLTANKLNAEPYKLEFWRKIASPLVVFGMIALVFPLVFGTQRQVSMGQRIFVGIIIGMSFHLLNQIFGNMAIVYQFPVLIGATLPSIVLLIISLVLFKRLR